jgi:hypothetical protein
MARDFKLTRTEAEYLVDLLDSRIEETNDGMASELGEQLRELFGMVTREVQIAKATFGSSKVD